MSARKSANRYRCDDINFKSLLDLSYDFSGTFVQLYPFRTIMISYIKSIYISLSRYRFFCFVVNYILRMKNFKKCSTVYFIVRAIKEILHVCISIACDTSVSCLILQKIADCRYHKYNIIKFRQTNVSLFIKAMRYQRYSFKHISQSYFI